MKNPVPLTATFVHFIPSFLFCDRIFFIILFLCVFACQRSTGSQSLIEKGDWKRVTTYGEKWWLHQLLRTDFSPRNDRLRNLWLSRWRSSVVAVWIVTIGMIKKIFFFFFFFFFFKNEFSFIIISNFLFLLGCGMRAKSVEMHRPLLEWQQVR